MAFKKEHGLPTCLYELALGIFFFFLESPPHPPFEVL
jgi:hypothetical protein